MILKKGYIETLESNQEEFQPNLNKLIKKYFVEPVGDGYIDMIILREKSHEFINDLTNANIAIETISWWCYCNEKNKELLGCPHGMGGPKSHYYEGWFSELGFFYDIEQKDLLELDENFSVEKIKEINEKAFILIKKIESESWFTNCLTPGIWAFVPDNWKSEELEILT